MRGLIPALLLLAGAPAAAQDVAVTLSTEPDGDRTLVHEIVIPAPVGEVWQAVSSIEGWRTWAVPLVRPATGSSGRFETSYDPDAAPGSAATIEQEWVAREPERRVAFRTTRTPAGFPNAETYLRVTSTFELEPDGDTATRLRLVGTDYAAGPEGDALIAFFREGNRVALQQLHHRFTDGPVDWTQATEKENP